MKKYSSGNRQGVNTSSEHEDIEDRKNVLKDVITIFIYAHYELEET
jgi:hypothetical protein